MSTKTVLARLPGHVRLKDGDRVPLAIEEGRLHLFDTETGRAITGPDRAAA